MTTLIHRNVRAAREGRNPAVACRARSGWVVMADEQVLPGYCLLLPDPVVPSLNDLDGRARETYLLDMASIGDALLELTDAVRINYEILGNLEPALHAHVIPRYSWEPPELRTRAIWAYDRSAAPRLDPAKEAAFMARLRGALERRGVVAT